MEESSTIFDIALYIGYFLVAVAVIAAIVLPLVKAMSNPRSLITIGIGIVALVVIFVIGYAVANNEVQEFYSRYDITSSGSKVIGGTIITMYILLCIALISIAFTEISKLFR